jgi:hypothetical protein
MSSLNTSTNGASISASYQKIVNSSLPTSVAANSPTYGQWAVFTVQAPLANAFQPDPSKESVLKVQTTGEGELIDMIEDFSDGKIQFAFVKVKDTNSGLPKNVLVCWCGEGVPERTKGYFTSHMNAVSKLLHGYHVQITARSDQDLTPEGVVRKVADSSGSKYSGGSGDAPAPSAGPRPPVASKPAMPTKSFGATGSYSMGGRSRAPAPAAKVDADGWGEDAPQVSRSQLEKVGSAYQPTKVDMAALQAGPDGTRSKAPSAAPSDPNIVRGGYQPIGKVDIAAIRKQAQSAQDDRPTAIKGAYEPIGKVDIADIRRKAQGSNAAPTQPPPPSAPAAEEERPRSLADRSAAFNTSERLTSLPKPKVANRFGADTSSFAGTKAPTVGGFESKPLATAAPIAAQVAHSLTQLARLLRSNGLRRRHASVATVEQPRHYHQPLLVLAPLQLPFRANRVEAGRAATLVRNGVYRSRPGLAAAASASKRLVRTSRKCRNNSRHRMTMTFKLKASETSVTASTTHHRWVLLANHPAHPSPALLNHHLSTTPVSLTLVPAVVYLFPA